MQGSDNLRQSLNFQIDSELHNLDIVPQISKVPQKALQVIVTSIYEVKPAIFSLKYQFSIIENAFTHL